jgi:hypothetical protein
MTDESAETGCGPDVVKNSRCADPSWVMFTTVLDPICCLPGEIGVQPQSGETYGHCVNSSASVPSGQLAVPVS